MNELFHLLPSCFGCGSVASICDSMAHEFDFKGGAQAVLPCSTGVIGWRLPVDHICRQLVRTGDIWDDITTNRRHYPLREWRRLLYSSRRLSSARLWCHITSVSPW